MMNVFVYGSLLFPEIAEGLCGKKLKSEEATLRGYSRFALKEADYPAIIKKNNAKVKGKVLLNLDENAIYLLTFYEGDDYGMAPVKVETNSGIVNAVAFVWMAGNEFLEDFDWDEGQFESESLAFYRDEIVPATRAEYYRRN
ncbi:gamma-glutamylcyclotransferase family protein [uncultured Draconibacterium sp.]|uniref:gamma-glutamylcyclotransferase family protein n=1 Tax=uncultured Draconibacterium sp. TaxID=1573823 RepID=UPI0029C8D183|nr:gamma-glutamylcyclotransferase family protein [uncultured Draconibacterium sp.]